ncbi:MAG: hypothetical protein LLF76_09615 [Planctomycetaceae bacterium]|nr:hypothetical protein [Planctomycetaceae bacterium]
MNLSTTLTDNMTEVLTRIIEFTERRRDVLTRNLFDYRQRGFRPFDLPVNEFALCMTEAVCEHVRSRRLLLCDRQHVQFETDGRFEAAPVVDHESENFLQTDIRQYLQVQIRKLSENLMNNRIAVELLKQRQQQNAL